MKTNLSKFVVDETLPDLKLLNLKGSPIQNIALPIQHDNLTTIDLSETQLAEFNTTTSILPKLSNLELAKVPIKSLHLGTGLSNLKRLVIEETKLTIFDSSKAALQNLTYLSLDRSPILTVQLDKLYRLRTLRMQLTKNSIFDTTNINLPELQILDMTDNTINHFDLGVGVPKLRTLRLKNTSLQRFDSFVAYLPQLTSLDLSNNNLVFINFSSLKSLEKLHLEGNKNITRIVPGFINSSSLMTVRVDNHSVDCDCVWLNYLHQYASKIKENGFEYNAYMCNNAKKDNTITDIWMSLSCGVLK